jgi:hypothetical protein
MLQEVGALDRSGINFILYYLSVKSWTHCKFGGGEGGRLEKKDESECKVIQLIRLFEVEACK